MQKKATTIINKGLITSNKHFGEHLMMDAYFGTREKLLDRKLILQSLNDLPDLVGMKKLAEPTIHWAEPNGIKDPGGWSGVVVIAESHISIHTFPDRLFASIDAYTCRNGLPVDEIEGFFKSVFEFKNIETNFIIRGRSFPVADLSNSHSHERLSRRLPAFPTFKQIEIADKVVIDTFVNQFQPYSDFNFTSLWAWDIHSQLQYCELNGNLVVQFEDYKTSKKVISFLGANKVADTAKKLIDYAENSGVNAALSWVPQVVVANLEKQPIEGLNFKVSADEDNYDYVCSVSELVTLHGQAYKSKRQNANRFCHHYADAKFESEALSGVYKQEVLALVARWKDNKLDQRKHCDAANEELAINKIFEISNNQNLVLSRIYVGDVLIGFSIDEILPNRYAISHFFKADVNYIGVYDFLNKKVAQALYSQDVQLWNLEQDLGIEALKKAKLSYKPKCYLKKYHVAINAKEIS